MNIGDIVSCTEYGIAIILGPCDVPKGVSEELLPVFLNDPDAWPTEKGWTVQLLEDKNKVLSVHTQHLELMSKNFAEDKKGT